MSLNGRKEDGRAEISVKDDGMTAVCVIYPSIGGGNNINIDYLRHLVQQAEIKVPVDWDAVISKTGEAQSRGRRVEFVIARGRAAVESIPEHVNLKKRFFLAATNQIPEPGEEGGRVDFRDYSPYTIVAKGEPVARLAAEFPGEPGVNVLGEPIPPPAREIMQFRPGDNLVSTDNRYTAGVDGLFVCKNGVFSILPDLLVEGDVDFHTGNIRFPGDVKVLGGVKRGFRILVKGHFYCGQTIEAGQLSIGGNLESGEGIIGSDMNSIKVGGETRCKFLENILLECRGVVSIKDSIFNSKVYTLDRIETGKEGKIIGGQVYSVNGIRAHGIGNEMGLYGELHVGENFVVSRQIAELRKKNVRLKLKLETLRQLSSMGKCGEAVIHKTEEEMDEMEAKIMEARMSVDKNRDAVIAVYGDIYPGVFLSICSATFLTKEKMTHVAFYLDDNHVRSKAL